jgi:hypothetical protein
MTTRDQHIALNIGPGFKAHDAPIGSLILLVSLIHVDIVWDAVFLDANFGR